VLSAIYIGDHAVYYGGVNSYRLSSYRWYIIPNDILPIENMEMTFYRLQLLTDYILPTGLGTTLYRLQQVRWQGGKVARWQGGKVAKWQGGKVARWQGG
jgi:hypothetical protein